MCVCVCVHVCVYLCVCKYMYFIYYIYIYVYFILPSLRCSFTPVNPPYFPYTMSKAKTVLVGVKVGVLTLVLLP